MGADSFVALLVLVLCLSKALSLPVARENQSAVPERLGRKDGFVLQRGLDLLQSLDSRLKKQIKEELEFNEVEAEASLGKRQFVDQTEGNLQLAALFDPGNQTVSDAASNQTVSDAASNQTVSDAMIETIFKEPEAQIWKRWTHNC
ncbi:uncharacterized protein LOC101161851 [Oryzias latipes]|uniref:uncharacterized protein LOC101161851 n=1 Tax=Oryzias latipes TaxID=8090 RepID=UPI000CE1F41F|nr:uncharacterized protein LOC101161851 [Oryzias latipes]